MIQPYRQPGSARRRLMLLAVLVVVGAAIMTFVTGARAWSIVAAGASLVLTLLALSAYFRLR